jgi:hypothetical protein
VKDASRRPYGRQGFCQNLDCLAPLEPPYQSAGLCLPGRTLATVLCNRCLPQPQDVTYPEMRLEVVAVAPVLASPGPALRLFPIVDGTVLPGENGFG